jgi:hypothetical protein
MTALPKFMGGVLTLSGWRPKDWPCPGHVSEIRRPSSQTGEQARAPTQWCGVDGADQAALNLGLTIATMVE